MVIVHRLSIGGHRYYLASVAGEGGDAPRHGEAGGRWMGLEASRRHLSGEVNATALRSVLPRGRGRVPGFDVTFAAPKSVSVLHGLGPPHVVDAVRAAHDLGVAAGVDYLERYACAVRTQGQSTTAPGLLVAAFRHRVSRADDPHLHTHALVVNVASAPDDGRPLALHSPLLYAERRGAAAAYHCVLRHELGIRLGVTWTAPVAGRADIEDVPVEIRAVFSRRRAAVLGAADGEVGERGWAERVTRPERVGLLDAEASRTGWLERIDRMGWRVPALSPTVLPAGAFPADTLPADLLPADVLPAGDRWTRSDLMVAIADRLREGGPARSVEAACERLLASSAVVRTETRRSARQAVPRYTTVAAIARQGAVDLQFEKSRSSGVPDDRPETLDRLRRHLAEVGHRLLIVAPDIAGAAALGDRTGALAVAAPAAAGAVRSFGLEAGDQVVVVRARRVDSAALAALLEAAHSRSVVVTDAPVHPGGPALDLDGNAPAATVRLAAGDLTVAGDAATAARLAIEDWLTVRRAGRPAVLIAGASEVAGANSQARTALNAVGLRGVDEVDGWAAGDVARFVAARPSLGIDRHDTANVAMVDPASGRIRLSFGDGRSVELRGAAISALEVAHAVPPLPALVAGRGDAFVIGSRGVGARHADGAVCRYITAAVPSPREGPCPARQASLIELDGEAALLRAEVHVPPLLTGRRRHLEDRQGAGEAWVVEAEARQALAESAGDRIAEAAWGAQAAAAVRELGEIREAWVELERLEALRRMAERAAAPIVARIAGIDSQIAVRTEALVRAAEFGGGRAPDDPVARWRWREAARPLAAQAERTPGIVRDDELQRVRARGREPAAGIAL